MKAEETGARLNTILTGAGLAPLDRETGGRFEAYFSLYVRWNERTNLSAIRDPEGILTRHFAESIWAARRLPQGVATLLDFGSGAGLPGIPIALCRPEIAITLAESQGKKAAFLQEAVRVIGIRAQVHAGRAEALAPEFDCVTLRAVDRMSKAVSSAIPLVAAGGWVAVMTTGTRVRCAKETSGAEICWCEPERAPFGNDRMLSLGKRLISS